jgi:hypothetical protein
MQLKQVIRILVFSGFLWHGLVACSATVQPFARLSMPTGVATDTTGNVFVTSDALLTTLVTKFNSAGQALGSIPIGGITVGNLGRLAVDPGSGELWDLLSGGAVLRINPRTGQVQPLVDLRSMPVDTGHVFDLASGTVGPFTGMLPQNSIYGDIALLRRGGRLDVFISGVSVAFPFIMRIRIENGRVAATVVAASRASGAGYSSGPRGVAVSPQGLVLTTLPTRYLNEEEIMDRMVAFSADYSEGQAPAPTAISREQLFSAGMDADGAGNFYIATGGIGAGLCGGGGSGAVVTVTADLKRAGCINFNLALAESADVAASRGGDAVYVSLRNIGLVVRAGSTPSTPQMGTRTPVPNRRSR